MVNFWLMFFKNDFWNLEIAGPFEIWTWHLLIVAYLKLCFFPCRIQPLQRRGSSHNTLAVGKQKHANFWRLWQTYTELYRRGIQQNQPFLRPTSTNKQWNAVRFAPIYFLENFSLRWCFDTPTIDSLYTIHWHSVLVIFPLVWYLKRGDFLAQKGAPKIGQKVAHRSPKPNGKLLVHSNTHLSGY